MRMLTFSKRCVKEIIRDPINLAFGLGFPLILLFLLSAIQANIPVSLFEIEKLAPGMTIFGLSFITLFSATLIAKDRESALLMRLYSTPLTSLDFILGYMLPLLPIGIFQTLICYIAGIILGMRPSLQILYAIFAQIPMIIFQISLGLLCGSLLSVKQVSGICGALLTNLTAYMSGVWFDLELVGVFFSKIANLLPFIHGAEMEKAIVAGNYDAAAKHVLPVMIYSIVTTIIAVVCYLKQMKRE